MESGGFTTLPPGRCYRKPAGASLQAILVPSSVTYMLTRLGAGLARTLGNKGLKLGLDLGKM